MLELYSLQKVLWCKLSLVSKYYVYAVDTDSCVITQESVSIEKKLRTMVSK